MAERTIQDLWQMQGLPLSVKVKMTQQRIRDWVHAYGEDGVYVSFSGGKDSTVLLHLVRELYPSVRGVFVDTGLEYPEIRSFVRTFDNIEWLKPKMTFKQVIQKYGYPFISKEVAECVYGARKYLTRVMEEASLEQTDRQTEPAYRYRFERLCGLGKFASAKSGGADRKYRKARGIGEFYSVSKSAKGIITQSGQSHRQLSDSTAHGDSSFERKSDSEEYP